MRYAGGPTWSALGAPSSLPVVPAHPLTGMLRAFFERRGGARWGRRREPSALPAADIPFSFHPRRELRPTYRWESAATAEIPICQSYRQFCRGNYVKLPLHRVAMISGLIIYRMISKHVTKLHHANRAAPYQANRVLAVLGKMFNLAERWGLRPDGSNPCRHVEKFGERKRERMLSPAELGRLGDALAAYQGSPYAVAAVTLADGSGVSSAGLNSIRRLRRAQLKHLNTAPSRELL